AAAHRIARAVARAGGDARTASAVGRTACAAAASALSDGAGRAVGKPAPFARWPRTGGAIRSTFAALPSFVLVPAMTARADEKYRDHLPARAHRLSPDVGSIRECPAGRESFAPSCS